MKHRSAEYWSQSDVVKRCLRDMRAHLWNADHWSRVIAPLLDIQDNTRVLDVGTGLGFLLHLIASECDDVRFTGVDRDANLVAEATDLAKQRGLADQFEFHRGDAAELPFDEATFELVTCQTVLMHLGKPEQAVAEMARVVTPGGLVVAIEPGGDIRFDSARETTLADPAVAANYRRWQQLISTGGQRARTGSNDIGIRVPLLFRAAGLQVRHVRCMDQVIWLLPPYQRPGDETRLPQFDVEPQAYVDGIVEHGVGADFVAGGGTEAEFQEYLGIERRICEARVQQIASHSFSTVIAQPMLVTIGAK